MCSRTPNSVRIRQSGRPGNRGVTYAVITPSTVEFFLLHKKETDLGIGEPVGVPSSDHPFCAGCRLYSDPAQQIDPITLISSSLVLIEKAPSNLIVKKKKQIRPN